MRYYVLFYFWANIAFALMSLIKIGTNEMPRSEERTLGGEIVNTFINLSLAGLAAFLLWGR